MENIGKNIRRFRREKKLTQEELASAVGVTPQAISKWERDEGLPDISYLNALSSALSVTIDMLLNHSDTGSGYSTYRDLYNNEELFWGLEPTPLCFDIIKRYRPAEYTRILVIGCGEGRDALFFARNGYNVTAFDIEQNGIDRLNKMADIFSVPVNTFCADMMAWRADNEYDIIYSSRVFHCIVPEMRGELIHHYQEHTRVGGVNAFNVHVHKPFIAPAPDKDEKSREWNTGELFSYYGDWLIDYMTEEIVDCNSSGIPHQHCFNVLMAKKVGDN